VCREGTHEAYYKNGYGHHGDYVKGPLVVAFPLNIYVGRAAFVSIYMKMHGSGLR